MTVLWNATLAVLVFLLAVLGSPLIAQEKSCTDCHTSLEELRKVRTDASRALESLLINPEVYKQSVHGSQACDDCHFDYDSFPHSEEAETPSCTDCHEDSGEHFAASIHGAAKDGVVGLPLSCTACHGVHDGFKPSDRRSKLHPLNVTATCGTCHFDQNPLGMTKDELAAQPLASDVHARGLIYSGLVVTANCVSCHGGHDIRATGDPESKLAPSKVDKVCGECHVTAAEEYRKSVHYVQEAGEQKGATCTSCHQPHHIVRTDKGFKAETSDTCAKCHDQQASTFHKSYHGRVSSFGFGDGVASCADCHGSHSILPSEDPASMTHVNNVVTTCAQCHEGAHAEFANFRAHLDPDDPEDNWNIWLIKQSMEGLLIFVFTFGGIHVALWAIRSIVGREWRLKAQLHAKGQRHIRRFNKVYVSLHGGLMSSVIFLALTGLPLHFAEAKWAIAVMNVFGGPKIAGFVHRVGAIVLTVTFVAYLLYIGFRLIVKKEKGFFSGPNTMLPRWKDVKDLLGNLRWFFFRGPKPRFDRWTYWEKFDFWAVFWGMLIIGGSGVILWFPEAMTHFVPGWMVNAAEVVHGHEALLAVIFLFTIHLFHGHLRTDKFPVDLVFYTGRITEAEFKHERPEEYERAVAEGRLEELYDREPSRGRRIMGFIVAALAVVIGVGLTVSMIATML